MAKNTKELTLHERHRVYAMLDMLRDGGDLPRGAFMVIGRKFSVDRATISRFWQTVQDRISSGMSVEKAIKSRRGETGRNQKWDRDALMEELTQLPLNERQTLRATAGELGIPHTTLFHMMNETDSNFVTHTSTLKTVLTEENKVMRVLYCIDKIAGLVNNMQTTRQTRYMYKDMMGDIHVDEKWFKLTQKTRQFILGKNEKKPTRQSKNSQNITKIMFLCAQARPRWNVDKEK